MYVWEYPNDQNWGGKRRIILLIHSLREKFITQRAQQHRQSRSIEKSKNSRATMQKYYS
jgi:hypothetical protein